MSPLSTSTDQRDAELSRAVADAAAAALIRTRVEAPADDLGRRGDMVAHRIIVDALAAARPGDAILSEEAVDDIRRVSATRVWIVDPLDGTREYGEPDRTDWAVHVALWADGALAAGAVALPGLGVTLATDRPPPLPARRKGRPRIAVSRTRPPAVVTDVAAALDADLVPMGSAGYKVAAVVRGEVDAYLHAGGQYEWDSAAPVAVALSAGLHASRIDGTPLAYNRADPFLPDLLVCRPELAGPLLGATACALIDSGTNR